MKMLKKNQGMHKEILKYRNMIIKLLNIKKKVDEKL